MPTGVYKRTEEHKKNTSKALKGKRNSPKTEFKKGNISPSFFLGKQHSEITKQRMSEAHLKRWDKIGRKSKRYTHLFNKQYKDWRDKVFKRDDYTCRECGIKGCYLQAHHIKSWAKYPKLRYVLSNGLTLCEECHKLTPNYKNRKEVKLK